MTNVKVVQQTNKPTDRAKTVCPHYRYRGHKNDFRIMKKTHAHLQTDIKTCVKFQKDQPETVKGVALTRYLLHIHFNSVRGKKKKSKIKMQK